MRKYSVNANLVYTIGNLHDQAINAVQMNDSRGERVKTKVGFRRGGFLLSPTLFNILSRKDYV